MSKDTDEKSTADDYARRAEAMPLGDLIREVTDRIGERIDAAPPAPPPVDEEAKARERRLMLLLDRGIPLDAADIVASDNLRNTKAIGYVKDFMGDRAGTLVISGGVGSGKTVAAAWMVSQRTPDKYVGNSPDGRGGTWPAELHPRFRDVSELTMLPRWGDAVAETMRVLKRCSILAIDDVGNETDTDESFVGVLDALIVARHDNRLRTVLTTNLPVEKFFKRYGIRIRDRVRGAGGFYGLGDAPSMRGEK